MKQYERFLEIIIMLTREPVTIDDIANRIKTTTRTPYRYIVLLEDLGFVVERGRGLYHITAWPKQLMKAVPGA